MPGWCVSYKRFPDSLTVGMHHPANPTIPRVPRGKCRLDLWHYWKRIWEMIRDLQNIWWSIVGWVMIKSSPWIIFRNMRCLQIYHQIRQQVFLATCMNVDKILREVKVYSFINQDITNQCTLVSENCQLITPYFKMQQYSISFLTKDGKNISVRQIIYCIRL